MTALVLWLLCSGLIATGVYLVVREALRLRRGWRVWRALQSDGSDPASSEPATFREFTDLTPQQREAVVQAILDAHPGSWRS